MALWGNKDGKTSSGTLAITTGGAVTGVLTSFTTQAAVGDFITAANTAYVITAISNNTVATVRSGTNGGSIAAVGAGNTYVISEKPLYVAYTHATGESSNNIFGVDTTEAGVAGNGQKIAHAGWVLRKVGTGGRAGRVQFETLVATGTISGDAENTVFPNS